MNIAAANEAIAEHRPSVGRVMSRALLWIGVSFVAGTTGAFVVAFFWSLLYGPPRGGEAQADLQAAGFIGALLLAAFAFHRAALHETRRSPNPAIRASIEPIPVRRWPVVVVACLALTPFGLFLAAMLVSISPAFQQMTLATDPLLLVLAWTLAATVTPYVEERFFRGWLWTALSLRLGVAAAALISGSLFLLAHVAEAILRGEVAGAIARGLVLLPLAIGLSVVRAACGTPRASMVVHGLYNLAVTAAPSALLAGGFVAA